ncbi:MAG: ComF family protein [Pseudomonadota bacterium]
MPVERCGRCSAPHLERPTLLAPFDYHFPVDRILAAFKYRADLTLLPVLRHWLENMPVETIASAALVPVPLHPFRFRRRGFNQATLIARLVAERCGGSVLDNAVVRRRHTAPQVGLTATERRRNLRDAFAVPEPLAHRHICIVDDVATTGATLQAVATSLRRSGVRSVSAFCLAYAGAGVYR